MSAARPGFRALALALLLPLLGGCFVTSENPVLSPGENGRDPALRGLWVTKEGREFLHVLRPELDDDTEQAGEAPGFSGLYIVSRGEDAEDQDNWSRMRIIAARIDDRGILSMRFNGGEPGGNLEEIPGWLMFAYEVRDGRLYLRMMREDPVDAAIKAGKLPGVAKSGSGSDPHVTASAEEWIAFLKQADFDSLFHDDEDSFLVRLSERRIQSLTEGKEAGEP